MYNFSRSGKKADRSISTSRDGTSEARNSPINALRTNSVHRNASSKLNKTNGLPPPNEANETKTSESSSVYRGAFLNGKTSRKEDRVMNGLSHLKPGTCDGEDSKLIPVRSSSAHRGATSNGRSSTKVKMNVLLSSSEKLGDEKSTSKTIRISSAQRVSSSITTTASKVNKPNRLTPLKPIQSVDKESPSTVSKRSVFRL